MTWLNLGSQTFSMIVENFIETFHCKLLISDIRPRHTSTALAAHFYCSCGTQVGKHCSRPHPIISPEISSPLKIMVSGQLFCGPTLLLYPEFQNFICHTFNLLSMMMKSSEFVVPSSLIALFGTCTKLFIQWTKILCY